MSKIKMTLHLTSGDLLDEDYKEANRIKKEADVERRLIKKEAIQVWDRVAPLLAAHGYLNDLFADTLVQYCLVICDLDETVKYLHEHGKTYTSETRNGLQIKNRPQVGELHELRRTLRGYVTEFGLSPQARKALEAVQMDIFDPNGSDENPFTRDQAAADAHSNASATTRH